MPNAAIPLICAGVVVIWALRMAMISRKFKAVPNPFWPFAQNPGLALELAPSQSFVVLLLGPAGTGVGDENRKVAQSLQKLDFLFIPLYAALFVLAGAALASWPHLWPVVAGAVVTAACDYWEDFRILGVLGGKSNARPPKPFGQAKWLFYFLTLAMEGVLALESAGGKGARETIHVALAAILILTGIGGAISALKGSFNGIVSATKLSVLGLLLLVLVPLIDAAPFSWRTVAVYVVLLRVPLLVAALLFLLPFVAFFTPSRALLRGLFDLTPWSVFVVALTVLAAAGSTAMAADIVLADGRLRFGYDILAQPPGFIAWIVIMIVLTLPIVAFSVGFSARQGHGFGRCLLGAAGGISVGLMFTWLVRFCANSGIPGSEFPKTLAATGLFSGYADAPAGHFFATAGFAVTLLVYIGVGIYGYSQLGRRRTVPALCSALMLLTMITWILAGVAFFFDLWRIPILLIVGAAGMLTAQSVRSDHYYALTGRSADAMPDASETIAAARRSRIIVAAANGGGIQAGAWAAQVLYGLQQDCGDGFRRSLRMISSVSGGSVGTAFYVHWLANPEGARRPDAAATESSLDEVAWGLGWTDFLSALCPWLFGGLMGRGRAIEKAWCLNGAKDLGERSLLDRPLSDWNRQVAAGEIPAVVMNATIAETGERLLLATTSFGGLSPAGKARVDARELHRINGQDFDVSIATAARMSATFPYVTPASRSNGPGPQPHVVDGGYYDNYGMATLVEWLDEALTGANGAITDVLVLQIHGAPVNENADQQRHEKMRGWFYQAIAPLTTLAAVRSAGQIAHNNIELELLRRKWSDLGVNIQTEVFEFNNPRAPLSWHLTPDEVAAIAAVWNRDMGPCRHGVKQFLAERTDS